MNSSIRVFQGFGIALIPIQVAFPGGFGEVGSRSDQGQHRLRIKSNCLPRHFEGLLRIPRLLIAAHQLLIEHGGEFALRKFVLEITDCRFGLSQVGFAGGGGIGDFVGRIFFLGLRLARRLPRRRLRLRLLPWHRRKSRLI